MAIVEDEVWNESEEENEIEVVVEEYNGEQDSDDSSDDDDDEVMEKKVADLELRIKEDPYNYDDHIELIQALWALTELGRWRGAFERLQEMTVIKPEHWLMRLQTEGQLTHTPEMREIVAELFQQSTLDCYYIQILSEWCSWSLTGGNVTHTRTQMQEVLKLAGADPLSGKLYWEAKLDFEKALLESMSEEDEKYKEQRERVLFCLEEIVSRPLLHGEELWDEYVELASTVHGQEYVDKAKNQHEIAQEYLQKISPFEDRILTLQNVEEICKYAAYVEYIDTVVELSKQDKYKECDSHGILKVLYERAITACSGASDYVTLLCRYARWTRAHCSRATHTRALTICTRRAPKNYVFWSMMMQQAEREEKDFTEIKTIFETALSKGMESYKHSERLWMSYVEYVRRQTDFNDEQKVDRLRSTLRLAWDSLAELWGYEANDCEIPLFWARIEYVLIKDQKRGKEIFEEIFKYGENKTMSKYWEALIRLEMNRSPPISENKLRELFRRAVRSVTDYPPAIVAMWTDYERTFGRLDTLVECYDTSEERLKEWREYYKAMKEKMTGKNQKPNKQTEKKSNKTKYDKRKAQESPKKRKSEDSGQGSEVKKKREGMEVDEKEREGSAGMKRSHQGGDSEVKDKKRQRRESSEDTRSPSREACTLFVSNLEFKVNEDNLRNKLSEYGDIVSLRVKSGVKAFGGSICYCQYKDRDSVDKAIQHDRTPLDGRPMFLSRYTPSKKNKPQFKYSTTTEKNKLFVRNLPFSSCTKQALTAIFGKHGKLKDIRVVTFKDGKPKGLAYIEYEDEASAATALEKTNGLKVGDKNIEVAVSAPPPRQDATHTLGQAKREPTGGMRRTQLSSFIPSVLANAQPSTSKAPDTHTNGDEKRPLSNNDFRSMLLKK